MQICTTRFPKVRTVAGMLIAALAVAGAARSSGADLKAGDKAPGFKLQGTDGKVHDLADYAGKKVVVLAWFPKAKTPGCTAECKSMRDNGKALKGLNVAYFTASVDKPEYNKEFAEELELDFPILSDPTSEVAKAYGVVHGERKVPERWTYYIGEDGKILAIDKQVKTSTHGADVAARLKELGVAEAK
ncbi:MAG: peroxiredoxin [Planctomycetaceae bacterium]|nr:peroxiredoxin [Planctomycetaceae bacterium]